MHHKTVVMTAIVSFLVPLWAAAQLPDPSQASLILATLDKDGDEKISNSEAPDQLKQNFTLVDRNSDGGIDLNELKAVLRLAAHRPGSGGNAKPKPGFAGLNLPAGGPSFGTLNPKQAMRMRSISSDDDGAFYMLNLIKYREHAVYRDGRETKLTGREADNLYSPVEFLAKIGAEIAYVGAVEAQHDGSEPKWEMVGIVKYPSRAKFVEMIADKKFQARSVHKDAGVELTQVVVTERVPWDASEASRANQVDAPKTAANQDAPFTLCHLVKYRDEAQYPDGHTEPKRSGRQAMELYQEAAAGVLADVGASPILRLKVEGVLIGDGREWNECRLIQFPSQHAFREAAENAQLQKVRHHRSAAIEDSYTLQLRTQIDHTAQIDKVRSVTTKRIGYEILHFKSGNEIVAWASQDITQEQFDALRLPAGWFKNQPREVEANGGTFLSSPDKDTGQYTRKKQFGFEWLHVATVTKPGMRLDQEGRLRGSKVTKDHRVSFDTGRILALLVSPKGDVFVRISRDVNRTREVPTLPRDWKLIDHKIGTPLEIALPKEALVIRTDNQDSFQGPVELNSKGEGQRSVAGPQ